VEEYHDTETVLVEVQEALETQGTCWLFAGTDTDGHSVTFGVDHRIGASMLDLLGTDGPFPASVVHWQVLSHSTAVAR
jgi:hypothetical protein